MNLLENIELCVFDMAGTTVDEQNVVYKTVQSVIQAQGYAVTLDAVLEHGAGKEKRQAIFDILHHCTDCSDAGKTADDAFAAFKPALAAAYQALDVQPIAGVPELFGALHARNIKVVLNTGYDRATAATLLNRLDWQVGRQIDGLITADDVRNGRPAPDMIQAAMRIAQVDNPAAVLKAGDSVIDIEEGKNAGCGVTVGVLTGAQMETQLQTARPTAVLPALTGLLQQT